jgi:hypothetical protein
MSHNQIEIMITASAICLEYLDRYQRVLRRIDESDLPNREQLLDEEMESGMYRFIELSQICDELKNSVSDSFSRYEASRESIRNMISPPCMGIVSLPDMSQTEVILRAILDVDFASRLKHEFQSSNNLLGSLRRAEKKLEEQKQLFLEELNASGGREMVDSLILARWESLAKLLKK